MYDSTRRFSDRVENYIRYRPHYPEAIAPFLQGEIGLSTSSVLADIGSGTGILAELFLKNGTIVYCIEPNQQMREAGEKLLGGYKNFISIAATAESTTLDAQSVDHILAGQAFHWFDLLLCKQEFHRILRPQGWVVLLWNERKMNSPFAVAYEDLLQRFGTDYRQIDHRNVDETILSRFFSEGDFRLKIFDNFQDLDYEGLKGRLLSASYIPTEGHPGFPAMITQLESLFHRFQKEGKVIIEYDTKMYYGKL